MVDFSSMLSGFLSLCNFDAIISLLIGVVGGMIIGALPGFSAAMGVSLLYILFNIGPYVITMHKKMGKEHPTAPQYFAQGNMATKLNNEANITIIVFLFILLYAINMEFPRFCIEGIVVHTKIIKVM